MASEQQLSVVAQQDQNNVLPHVLTTGKNTHTQKSD